MIKLILLMLLLTIGHNTYAEDSPFDVLNSDDRYKSEAAVEFDVNEGDEEVTAIAPRNDPFDVISQDQVEEDKAGSYYGIAKIIALNKITAKSQALSIKVGSTAYFGNIAISVKKCWSNNDPYLPQNKILLDVVESKIDEDPKNIFSGWMISSNIQASALEHPSYELIAINCNDK